MEQLFARILTRTTHNLSNEVAETIVSQEEKEWLRKLERAGVQKRYQGCTIDKLFEKKVSTQINDSIAPKTGVLINKWAIASKQELERIERRYTAGRIVELRAKSIAGNFDLFHLQKIHKQIFQDIYAWAGKIRRVNISKGDVFCLPEHIEGASGDIFRKLDRQNHLKELNEADFAAKAGELLSDLNHLHPFREGNGRSQREFISQLAEENGYHLDWEKISKERMIEASIEGMRAKDDKLKVIFREIISQATNQESRYVGQQVRPTKGKTIMRESIAESVRQAIASLRMEGLDLAPEEIADLERVARGENLIEQHIADLNAWVKLRRTEHPELCTARNRRNDEK